MNSDSRSLPDGQFATATAPFPVRAPARNCDNCSRWSLALAGAPRFRNMHPQSAQAAPSRSAAPAPHNGRRPAGGNLRFRANVALRRARAAQRAAPSRRKPPVPRECAQIPPLRKRPPPKRADQRRAKNAKNKIQKSSKQATNGSGNPQTSRGSANREPRRRGVRSSCTKRNLVRTSAASNTSGTKSADFTDVGRGISTVGHSLPHSKRPEKKPRRTLETRLRKVAEVRQVRTIGRLFLRLKELNLRIVKSTRTK